MIEITKDHQRENGIAFFTMKSDELIVKVTNLGCHILSIFAKDRNGILEDMVLGFEDVEDCFHDGSYMGAIVGRVANRIRGASFDLNNTTYLLAANNGPNHLHGGLKGFNQKMFESKILENGMEFHYTSPDMEEGYPGTLYVTVRYLLNGNCLTAEYEAESDKDTLCNLTNHSYFNLTAGKRKIYDHQLKINADKIACVDENCCTNGQFMNVKGTAFDFHDFHQIGERINDNEEQLKLAAGYDHSFLLNGNWDQVILYDEDSGRKLIISTTLPAAQIYTGNFLSGGCNGKHGKPYKNRDGVAIETQYLPDSIHMEEEPKAILRKGEIYQASTSYRFEVE
ncbi:MAG: aldose epimerase family protein [Lachnospiraceae bacterium]|nr:aldose epimerase family protein [Lachnospiraceae bacterium]